MDHVVLLGDSIFDNASYVPGGDPVIEQLRSRLDRGCRATLLAVDGAIASDVHRQLPRVPDDATHLLLSAGGNDALQGSGMLYGPAAPRLEVFEEMAAIQQESESQPHSHRLNPQ